MIPQGKRIPRPDRWEEFQFEWQDPVLPASKLRPAGKVAPTAGPFASRLKSIYEDRPEAVERLCAAAEARAAIVGEEKLFTELTLEMASPRWSTKRLPQGQRTRLRTVVEDPARPAAWRKSAEAILAMDARPRPDSPPEPAAEPAPQPAAQSAHVAAAAPAPPPGPPSAANPAPQSEGND